MERHIRERDTPDDEVRDIILFVYIIENVAILPTENQYFGPWRMTFINAFCTVSGDIRSRAVWSFKQPK